MIAFLKSLPELLSVLKEIISGVKAISAFIEANKEEAWFRSSAEVFSDLKKTVNDGTLTPDQRKEKLKASARGLRDLIGGL